MSSTGIESWPAPACLRGRRAQPACAARHRQPVRICLLNTQPMLTEWVHAAAARAEAGNVIVLPTLRRVRTWLCGHHQCRVILIEHAEGMWILDLTGEYAPIMLPAPGIDALAVELRKIFHRIADLPAGPVKIAA